MTARTLPFGTCAGAAKTPRQTERLYISEGYIKKSNLGGKEMWVSKNKWIQFEKRIADVEENQTKSANMVKDYILDSENLSNQLNTKIDKLPESIEKLLSNYSLDK